MKTFKLAISLIALLIILIYSIAFASSNNHEVTVDFLVGLSLSLPVSIWLMMSFATGLLISISVGLLIRTSYRLKIKKYQKELSTAQQRLNKIS